MNPGKASDFIAMLLENPEMDIEKAEKIAQMLEDATESDPKINDQIYQPALWEAEIDQLLKSTEQEAMTVIHEQVANALCQLSKHKKEIEIVNKLFSENTENKK